MSTCGRSIIKIASPINIQPSKHEGKVENLYEEKGHDAMFLLDIVEGVLLPSNELRLDDA